VNLPLDPLLPHLPAWLLVMFRISGIFLFAPVLASTAIPTQVKVFWTLGVSFCVYPMLLTPGSASLAMLAPAWGPNFSLWQLPAAIASELTIGLVIGYGASLPLVAMQTAGHMADQQLGLGLGELYNPDLGEQAGAFASLYYMLGFTLFVIVGGHREMLMALVRTFDRVPLASTHAPGAVVELALGLLTSMFDLAMRVSAPLLGLVFLETVAMGFLARTVPQLNVMSLGFGTRILMGVSLLIVSMAAESHVFLQELRRTLATLDGFFGH
jgi:flagellar biosynthesis protein FliR